MTSKLPFSTSKCHSQPASTILKQVPYILDQQVPISTSKYHSRPASTIQVPYILNQKVHLESPELIYLWYMAVIYMSYHVIWQSKMDDVTDLVIWQIYDRYMTGISVMSATCWKRVQKYFSEIKFKKSKIKIWKDAFSFL